MYTSTVGCIGVPHDGIGRREHPGDARRHGGRTTSARSSWPKQVALEFARDGLPVVIVNPTAPVGDHDVKPTPTGKIVLDFLSGDMPAFIDTGLNVVDVRDTAEGTGSPASGAGPGERYILGSENLTLAQILQKLAAHHRPQGAGCAAAVCGRVCAGVCSTAWAGITGTPPRVPLDAVRMARKKMWVTHEKAARELGFHPGPADIGAATRRRMVRPECRGVMRLLLVAADPHGVSAALPARATEVRRLPLAIDGPARHGSAAHELILVANGAGWSRAAAAVDAALPPFSPRRVISTGFCGALDDRLRHYDIVMATGIAAGGRHHAAAPVNDGSAHTGRHLFHRPCRADRRGEAATAVIGRDRRGNGGRRASPTGPRRRASRSPAYV